MSWLPQSSHDRSLIFNSTRRQNVSWESCPLVSPSVEYLRKPKSTLIQASFSFFSTHICGHREHALNASSVSTRDQSCPGSPPPMLKHKYRVNKIVHINEEEGESLGTRLAKDH